MLYICETGDDKQSMRSRLFEIWFNMSPRRSEFTIVQTNIKDEEGIINYAAIISRLDNPYLKEVVTEFLETAKLLNSKPPGN